MAGEQLPSPNPIAALNDAFRRSTGEVYATPGVSDFKDFMQLLQAVRDYDNFTPENDPWGEHDFGALDWHNKRTFWKIDYYDQELQHWCDPLSPDCSRVLTVILASEY